MQLRETDNDCGDDGDDDAGLVCVQLMGIYLFENNFILSIIWFEIVNFCVRNLIILYRN